jgi:hypothetical protein
MFLPFIFSPNFSILRWTEGQFMGTEEKVVVMGLGDHHHHHIAIIHFLDVIHHLVFFNVLETGLLPLSSGTRPTQLGPINRGSSYLWTPGPT